VVRPSIGEPPAQVWQEFQQTLYGKSASKQCESLSLQVASANLAQTDRQSNAIISNGGAERTCGWCNDSWVYNPQPFRLPSPILVNCPKFTHY